MVNGELFRYILTFTLKMYKAVYDYCSYDKGEVFLIFSTSFVSDMNPSWAQKEAVCTKSLSYDVLSVHLSET